MLRRNTIGIVGTGQVGMAAASALFQQRIANELILIDRDHRRAEGEAMDLMHAQGYAGRRAVRAGGYEDLAEAQIVIVTAGVGQKPGEDRLSLLNRNVLVFKEIAAQLDRHAPEAILLTENDGMIKDVNSGFTRLFGSIGFDATTTLEIADEADVTEPLIYYHFKGKHELFKISLDLAFNEYFARLNKLPKRTSTEFQKFANIIDLHFQIVDDLPEQMRMIVTTCPAKLNDLNNICLKNIKKARQIVVNYISDCLNAGKESGEFRKVPVPATANMLVALLNGLLRQGGISIG